MLPEGSGRLSSISTGVVVRQNGIILTAYHAIKNAHEVQVRLSTGEVYDRAEVLGTDERRDVAAIRISAAGLPTLPVGTGAAAQPGEAAYVVSSSAGLGWSASKGIISAVRMADDVPGAGNGYRVLQFAAPIAGGASGGPVANADGALLGIITKGLVPGAGGATVASFAVPIESVIGLADGTGTLALGSGAALQMPKNQPTPSVASSAAASSSSQELFQAAKTVCIETRSMYFTTDTLEKALNGQKGFDTLGLALVKDPRVADLLVKLDRPLFTYTFTYEVTDAKTSRVLDAGKVTAIDGNGAAGRIAKQLVVKWTKARTPELASEPK